MGQADVCWVLEDFHKLESSERQRLAQVMKVFVDEGDNYPRLKIIAIGAVDTARQVVECDAEMRHRVAEIHVPLMSEEEIREIITRGEQLLNFELSAAVREGTVSYTNGVASVCHDLCLKICQAIGIVETLTMRATASNDHLEQAIQQYLKEMEDTIKGVFDRALRSHSKSKFGTAELNGLIVFELAQFSQDGATQEELLARVRRREPGYRTAGMRLLLDALQTDHRGSLLRFDNDSGRYSFRDPILRTVAKLRGGQRETPRRDPVTRRDLLRRQEEDFKNLVRAVATDLGWEVVIARRRFDPVLGTPHSPEPPMLLADVETRRN